MILFLIVLVACVGVAMAGHVWTAVAAFALFVAYRMWRWTPRRPG